MHYLHLGDQYLHYIIDQPPTATADDNPLPFQHWQWPINRAQPLAQQLQQLAEQVPYTPHTPLHVVVNNAATIVPMADFDEAHCAAHLNYTLPQRAEQPLRRAFYDVLPLSNAVLIFGLSENICTAIEHLWNNVYYVAAQTGLLRRFATRQESPKERRCFIHLREHSIDVACYEGTNLLGYNTFEASQTADVVYYACQMATVLHCPPATTPFYLCGEAAQCEALATTLSDYVANIEVSQLTEEFAHHPLTTVPQLPFEFITHILST